MIIRYCVPTAPRLCICNPHAHCSCFPMQPPPSQPGNTAEHIRYLCFTLIVGTCPSLQQCGQQWEFHRTGFLTWNCLDSTKSTFLIWFLALLYLGSCGQCCVSNKIVVLRVRAQQHQWHALPACKYQIVHSPVESFLSQLQMLKWSASASHFGTGVVISWPPA